VLSAIYIIMGVAFCGLLIVYKPSFTWPGLIIALAGVPLYYARRSYPVKGGNFGDYGIAKQ
jgi:APA family basic amino acid/polyamine antiporter